METSSDQQNSVDSSDAVEPNKSEEAVFKAPPILTRNEEKATESERNPEVVVPKFSVVAPSLDYTPPVWACSPEPTDDYGFDVIKNGSLIETIKFSKRHATNFVVIGRLASCDIQLEHPSISRHHCILQYGEDIMDRTGKGWHLYDLGSTHGTKLNKRRIPPKQYIRIRVGHVMQFGGSTRIMNLVGPSSDIEAELDYSPSELKRMKEEKKLKEKLQKFADEEKQKLKKEEENEAHSSGSEYDEELLYARMREDFDAEENEAKYQKDPLKALSHFYEQEGFEMEFSYTEMGTGYNHKWACSIELPVDTAAGQTLSATATCSGSKKEAQIACALNACRVLDMHGVLYRASNVRRKRQKNLEENDFYDSDEDTFFDRTGQVEKNRENRKRRALEAQGKEVEKKETYEDLLKKISSAEEQMRCIESQLNSLNSENREVKNVVEEDDLDAFCRRLSHHNGKGNDVATKMDISRLRLQLIEVKHEKDRMERLAKILKPYTFPELKVSSDATKTHSSDAKKASSVSAATMKKLLTLRRAKAAVNVSSTNMEPYDIKATHEKPFVAEEEDENGCVAPAVVWKGPALEETPTPFASESSKRAVVTKEASNAASEGGNTGILEEKPEPSSHDSISTISVDDKQTADKIHCQEPTIPLRRQRNRVRKEKTIEKTQEDAEYGIGSANRYEDYVTWMPPDEQSGDGKTALNVKFAGRY